MSLSNTPILFNLNSTTINLACGFIYMYVLSLIGHSIHVVDKVIITDKPRFVAAPLSISMQFPNR